jgi:PIN domain nuclease of toxin-antitoxin system
VRYLLDTHTFLWWIADDPRMSPRVRAIIREHGNEINFSAASAWEIAIKAALGRITFQENPRSLIPAQVLANGFASLHVETHHALEILTLPPLHRDPFDRLLIAQALAEDLPLLTSDGLITQYPVPTVW